MQLDPQLAANERCVRLFTEEFWNQGNRAIVDTLITPDFYDHAYAPHDKTGMVITQDVVAGAFSDVHYVIDDLVAQHAVVIARMRMQATHSGTFQSIAPTGRQIDVEMYHCYRLHEGKIAEHWALFNLPKLLEQLNAA